ncbi:hypothetical protein D3C83_71120 [compost metagenome]
MSAQVLRTDDASGAQFLAIENDLQVARASFKIAGREALEAGFHTRNWFDRCLSGGACRERRRVMRHAGALAIASENHSQQNKPNV